MAEWKTSSWHRALRIAGLRYRWHDLRHTFVTRLAENPPVSELPIRSLAGHVSKKMLERYSHIRTEAKRAAIADLEVSLGNGGEGSVQKPAQSGLQPPRLAH